MGDRVVTEICMTVGDFFNSREYYEEKIKKYFESGDIERMDVWLDRYSNLIKGL